MFTNALVVLMGLMCVVAAFKASTVRTGLFSKGPGVPLSRAGRGILLVGGLLIIAEGIRPFLKGK